MERGQDTLPTTSLGQYKVRSKIGSGGMGDVYDALHTGLDKRVAIKTLRKRYLDDDVVVARFLREGQLASRIRHPNIVDVTDVGMMGGLPCLVMEHLEGESLSGTIRREGKLSPSRIVDLMLPIIAAVDFAHDHGIVHRDLKPSNIFLSRSWNGEMVPKVLDFGISKLVHDTSQEALTTDSAFVGTPHYASPELMRADKTPDGRSDQYSMGVILYEAVTGVRPFADLGSNFVALAMAICKGEYPPATSRNPALPAAFDRVIQRTMAIQREDRFITMRALGEALLPFASEREKMIWGPTFKGQSGQGEAVTPHSTPPGSRGPNSATIQATIPSAPPFSNAMPAAVPPAPMSSSRSLSGPPTPHSYPQPFASNSGMPMYGAEHIPNAHPSATPPAAVFDRLPSYGAGTSVAPPLAKPRGSGMITAVIGVSIGVAVAASVMVLRTGGSAKPNTSSASSSSSSSSSAVVQTPVDMGAFAVDVQITPSTAALEVDGAEVGHGRLVRTFTRDGKKHALRLSAPGYETLVVEFDEAHPPPASIALRPVAGGEAKPEGKAAGGGGGHRPSTTPAGGKKPGSDGRPKTDNIDPWE